jgi:hypothetical protein
MISLFDLIAFTVYIVSVSGLLIVVAKLKKKNANQSSSLLQAALEKQTLLSMLEHAMDQKESNEIEKSDGFLKFVSDSRDWAFQYIEEVQAALETFKSKVDLDLKYITKYGQLIEHPLQDSINKIAEAYTELQSVLPQDKDQV